MGAALGFGWLLPFLRVVLRPCHILTHPWIFAPVWLTYFITLKPRGLRIDTCKILSTVDVLLAVARFLKAGTAGCQLIRRIGADFLEQLWLKDVLWVVLLLDFHGSAE